MALFVLGAGRRWVAARGRVCVRSFVRACGDGVTATMTTMTTVVTITAATDVDVDGNAVV